MADQIHSQHPDPSRPVIHRGPWVVRGVSSELPGSEQKPLEDGALFVADGLIQATGRYRDIKKEFGQYHIQDHEGKILAPALINGHCHLELSHLDFPSRIQGHKGYNGDITGWIRDLLSERERFYQENADPEKLILHHARQALQHMSAGGVAFIGDVGNLFASRTIGKNQNTRVCFLLELLGLTKESELKTFARFEKFTADDCLDIVCTPHAPYSTTPALIKAMKMQAARQKHIVSIHVAESMQEVEFLQSGTGGFKEFLLAREAWDGSFTIPAKGSVEYLASLGVLDNKTICVHGVHVDSGEVKILSKKNAKVCLCPGSNRFLGVGKAPVTEFLDHGILPALGTDSMASNLKLSMWREMRLLREDHPGLSPELVFAMATRGGAEAWEVASEMGSLEPGKQPLILAVNNDDKIDSPGEIFDFLTSAGESVQKEWLG